MTSNFACCDEVRDAHRKMCVTYLPLAINLYCMCVFFPSSFYTWIWIECIKADCTFNRFHLIYASYKWVQTLIYHIVRRHWQQSFCHFSHIIVKFFIGCFFFFSSEDATAVAAIVVAVRQCFHEISCNSDTLRWITSKSFD